MEEDDGGATDLSFEGLVGRFYARLYQFALGLSGAEAEAGDLTQQTFVVWAQKGHQLRDPAKVGFWLFSTLHREFLKSRRRQVRFRSVELTEAEEEIPAIAPAIVEEMDAASVWDAFREVDELYRAPLALFYLEDLSYKEIAEVLEVPLGTVQSRIARGKQRLQAVLASRVKERAHRG